MTKTCNARSCRTSRIWGAGSRRAGQIQWRIRRTGSHDLDTTSKQRSRSFILVPIDFSYTTFYRLSI